MQKTLSELQKLPGRDFLGIWEYVADSSGMNSTDIWAKQSVTALLRKLYRLIGLGVKL